MAGRKVRRYVYRFIKGEELVHGEVFDERRIRGLIDEYLRECKEDEFLFGFSMWLIANKGFVRVYRETDLKGGLNV
jgi:hypothetical protein